MVELPPSIHDAKSDPPRRAVLAAVGAVTGPGCIGDSVDGTASRDIVVEEVRDGLRHPWGIAFLPDDPRLLVTERGGRLLLIDREGGESNPVAGTPTVDTAGQGGLLDVAIHPAFPDDPWVYLTYAGRNTDGGTATHLGRGRLNRDGPRLDGFEVIHVVDPFVGSTGHYGSRVVFGDDDRLYMTSGDRQLKNFCPDHVAQDPSNELGATLRMNPDGSIPADNPFTDDPAGADAVYSYGHRNAQGMAIHPETGAVWQSEHGEQDGDELNVITAGGNYGWPIADHGCTYRGGDPIGDPPAEREDVVDPVHYWPCNSGGFPPAGMTFYDSDTFSHWRGDLFVGNLAGKYLGRFAVDGRDVVERDPLLADRDWRVRDVAVAPETGYLYVAVDAAAAPLVRVMPASDQ